MEAAFTCGFLQVGLGDGRGATYEGAQGRGLRSGPGGYMQVSMKRRLNGHYGEAWEEETRERA